MAYEEGAGVPAPISAVLACRSIAGAIWRGVLDVSRFPGLRTGGLSTESAVRSRLRSIGDAIDEIGPAAPLSRGLHRIGWADDDPLTILEKTEHLLRQHVPDPIASPEVILLSSDDVLRLLAKTIVIQSLAARLDRWVVGSDEAVDAAVAQRLYGPASPAISARAYVELFARGDELVQLGRAKEAIRAWLEADRIQRTSAGLTKVGLAAWRDRDVDAALWALRAALLEEPPEVAVEEQPLERTRLLALARRLERVVGELRPAAPERFESVQGAQLPSMEIELSGFGAIEVSTSTRLVARAIPEPPTDRVAARAIAFDAAKTDPALRPLPRGARADRGPSHKSAEFRLPRTRVARPR